MHHLCKKRIQIIYARLLVRVSNCPRVEQLNGSEVRCVRTRGVEDKRYLSVFQIRDAFKEGTPDPSSHGRATPDRSRWRSSSSSVLRAFGSRSGTECCLGSTTYGPACMAAASKPVLWTSRSGSGAVCRSDGIHMWQFERNRPEGRARATRRQWHRRGTHWVEHGVRHGCMSCARGQLWRDEGSLRQTTARLSGRRRRADACR